MNVLESACVSFMGQREGLPFRWEVRGCQQPSNARGRENENTILESVLRVPLVGPGGLTSWRFTQSKGEIIDHFRD